MSVYDIYKAIKSLIKLIFIIFSVVIGIYLFNSLNMFKDYNVFLESPQSAREQYNITNSQLKTSEGHFGISSGYLLMIGITDTVKKKQY